MGWHVQYKRAASAILGGMYLPALQPLRSHTCKDGSTSSQGKHEGGQGLIEMEGARDT